MNETQKKIIFVSVVIVVLMGIFPPWQIKTGDRIINMGYWFITNPPVKFATNGYTKFGSELNLSVLFIQWAITAMMASGLVFWKRDI